LPRQLDATSLFNLYHQSFTHNKLSADDDPAPKATILISIVNSLTRIVTSESKNAVVRTTVAVGTFLKCLLPNEKLGN